jgi:hypothetical protein
MATYGQNTTIKVNAAISNTASNANLYTAPANGYAVVLVHLPTGGQVLVGGVVAFQSGASLNNQLYVGPGQTAYANGSNITISGVEFINTP